jgi:small-conductance mechanosensitive channel
MRNAAAMACHHEKRTWRTVTQRSVTCYHSAVKVRRSLLTGLFTVLLLAAPLAHAQDGVTQADEARLVSLYRSLLKYPEDQYLKQRIADERADIRTAIQREVQKTFAVPPDSAAPADGQALPKALDQQRATVKALEERLKARKVDRDLLIAEEKRYYGGKPLTATGAVEDFRLTKTHEELLARVAVIEERVAVLSSVLSLEQQRLRKLTADQWLSQFGNVIRILTFVGIIAVIAMCERFVRGVIVRRILQPQKRYVLTKILTTAVYGILAIWLLTTLFAEHPGILTSLAIVGAGFAVALQDLVKDVVGWIVILQKRLFTLGDRVSVGPYTGDVVDISLLRTTMLEVNASPTATVQERSGRTLYMPNAAILVHDTVSYHRTSDYLKSELRLQLTLESNWEKAEGILREILEEITSKYTEAARRQYGVRTRTLFLQFEPSGPQIYTDIAADGIEITLRFTIPIGMRRDVHSEITRAVLRRFAAERDIGLAYRTSMAYNAENPPPPLHRPDAK